MTLVSKGMDGGGKMVEVKAGAEVLLHSSSLR